MFCTNYHIQKINKKEMGHVTPFPQLCVRHSWELVWLDLDVSVVAINVSLSLWYQIMESHIQLQNTKLFEERVPVACNLVSKLDVQTEAQLNIWNHSVSMYFVLISQKNINQFTFSTVSEFHLSMVVKSHLKSSEIPALIYNELWSICLSSYEFKLETKKT